MILGIDGSNVRTGGGVTYLSSLLSAVDYRDQGIDRVVLWGGASILGKLPSRPCLRVHRVEALEAGLSARIRWQRLRLPALARTSCNLLFAPGGTAPRVALPLVAASQNLLPFELGELARYRCSLTTLRLVGLRFAQASTFRRADGVIFLSEYARQVVMPIARPRGRVAVIPHGVEEHFRCVPRSQLSLTRYSPNRPFRFLYVSIVDAYKHQGNVARAIARARADGYPLAADFVGPGVEPFARRFRKLIAELDPTNAFLRYRGPIAHEDLASIYRGAHAFIFASTCENLPNILLEAMASGLPIAASARGPMPDLVSDGALLFDPENLDRTQQVILKLAIDASLRRRLATTAYDRASAFTWKRCARETFAFLARCAAEGHRAPRAPNAK